MVKKINDILVVAAIACLAPNSASADEKTSGRIAKPDVIQVTAQKHTQNIEDIAVSVSVITGQTIVEQNIKDTTALSSQSPNFMIAQNAGEGTPPAVNIRGVGSVDYNNSTTSPVGIYLDDVAGGSANSQLINLFDIESVEILRGPQGTLFGRNTNAGAVLIRSHRPEDEFGGDFMVGFAEHAHKKVEGAINAPINNNVAARLAFSHQDYEYSTTNLYPQAPVAGMRQQMWRLSVAGKWQDVEVFTKLHSQKWDGIVQPVGSIGVVKSIDSATGLPSVYCTPAEAGSLACTDAFGFNDGSDDFHDVKVNIDNHGNSPHRSDGWGGDFHLNYQLSETHHLESITSFNTLDRIHFFDGDASPARLGEGLFGVETEVYTQELRLHADLDKLYLIGGLYFLNESLEQGNFMELFGSLRSDPQDFGSALKIVYDNQIETTAFAVFGHAEYKMSDKTTFTAGLRYSDESTDYRAVGTLNVATVVNDETGLDIPGWDVTGAVEGSNLSGKLALNHSFSDQVSGFTSYARGFKSGGYNGAFVFSLEAAQRSDFGSETLDAYEIGSRFNWDDRNARLNLSLFYYDYQDQQVFMNQQALDPSAPPIQLLDNVGKSVIYGLETDLNWQLNPAFRVQLAIGYLPEANLESFVDAAGVEINDNRLPYTSKWNVSGLMEYVVTLSNADLVWQLNFDHQANFYFDQNENPYASQKSYTLLNGRIAYEREDWTLALWGKNLTNEKYSVFKFDAIGFLGLLQDNKGPSRQLGIDVSYAF